MATYERLDYGSDDGSKWGGTSTDKLGFYDLAVPIAQASIGLGLSTVTHASTLISSVVQQLKAVGLFRT